MLDSSIAKKISPKAKIIQINYPSSISAWAKLKGIKIIRGKIRLWKIVQNNGTDFYKGLINYDIMGQIIAPDWNSGYREECGKGLHLSDTPSGARYFYNGDQLKNARLFEVEARVSDCRAFPGTPSYPMKLRARACRKIKEWPIDYNSNFEDKKQNDK
jgi:hypothetical protein